MKLPAPALAGLVAVTVASPAPTNAAAVATVKYKNDATHTYKCDSGTIVLSCVRSGTCSFVEKCTDKCIVDTQGAGCTGAAVAVEESHIVGRAANYLNNEAVSYHCDRDQYIIACPAPPNGCAAMVECLVKCIENKLGAECADQKRAVAASTDVGPASLPQTGSDEMITNDLDAKGRKKRYECSDDRTGVLVCQYGFCQTDHYCKRGTSCYSRCNCCKKSNLASRGLTQSDHDEAPQPITGSDLPVAVFENSVGVAHGLPKTLNAVGRESSELSLSAREPKCQPGHYRCQYHRATNSGYIVVCGQDGIWHASADCGSNMRCLEFPAGVAHCWPLETLKAAREETRDLSTPVDVVPCQAGHYKCFRHPETKTSWIIACDGKTWHYSADCGPNQKCAVYPPSGGVAHCLPL
ncbi:hypothetical protein BDW02DRAFT_633105 [Decorospora gaudefroyi]|uniref:Uncharacterized protein n=1 Tax=Decorospora gaudefroyi TaxID=184978 RepID=A0A6A5K9J8_9PLEO|nr:hypothetical protein BDW02DRAFT_633105 [Decorospora gaudefroyi]